MRLCASCKKADVSCPICPSDTDLCVEYMPANELDGKRAALYSAGRARDEGPNAFAFFRQMARLVASPNGG